jgi:membrane protease YdiL (CAAX protease family)
MSGLMTENPHSQSLRFNPLPGLILLWMGYTLFFALYIPEPAGALIGFIPGLLGVALMCWYKASLPSTRPPSQTVILKVLQSTCFLRVAPLSPSGLAVLAGMLLLMVPVVISGLQDGGWTGWDWGPVLVYALASGISQELFFRSALFPGLLQQYPGQPKLVLLLQALLFALFHVGMFTVAPSSAALSAMLVTFLAGLGWGWQVRRDQTVLWAMLHHALLQVILRGFAWG